MKHNYDFYRFSRLVVDLLVTPNNLNIPYDLEMETIGQFYDLYKFDEQRDGTPYEGHCNFILNNEALLISLKELAE